MRVANVQGSLDVLNYWIILAPFCGPNLSICPFSYFITIKCATVVSIVHYAWVTVMNDVVFCVQGRPMSNVKMVLNSQRKVFYLLPNNVGTYLRPSGNSASFISVSPCSMWVPISSPCNMDSYLWPFGHGTPLSGTYVRSHYKTIPTDANHIPRRTSENTITLRQVVQYRTYNAVCSLTSLHRNATYKMVNKTSLPFVKD